MPENDIDSNGRARTRCQAPNGVLLEVRKTNRGLRMGSNAPSSRLANMTCIMRDQGTHTPKLYERKSGKANRISVLLGHIAKSSAYKQQAQKRLSRTLL